MRVLIYQVISSGIYKKLSLGLIFVMFSIVLMIGTVDAVAESHDNIMWQKSDDVLIVNIQSPNLTILQHDAISSSILSSEVVSYGEQQYYVGWAGAVDQIESQNTRYDIPSEFVITQTKKNTGDVIIELSNKQNFDGNNGYTELVYQGNQIIKAHITIYNVDELSISELQTIIRHEFGHALGLEHSPDPNDLMAHNIITHTPFISDCAIYAMYLTYDGQKQEWLC